MSMAGAKGQGTDEEAAWKHDVYEQEAKYYCRAVQAVQEVGHKPGDGFLGETAWLELQEARHEFAPLLDSLIQDRLATEDGEEAFLRGTRPSAADQVHRRGA